MPIKVDWNTFPLAEPKRASQITAFKMERTCQVVPYETASGAANMGIDDALLDAVAGGFDGAFLRTYGWSTPTLSLGYFQHAEEAMTDPRWNAAPIVRRLSGGGAIWHHHEVTYALVVPATHPFARPSEKLYHAVHLAVLDGLRNRGVRASRRGNLVAAQKSVRKSAFLCFTDTNPEDIVTVGIKIVGSAQRRRGGAVLQHGSLLLARSWRAPELPGLCDVADFSTEPIAWSTMLTEQIAGALGLHSHVAVLPEELRSRAKKYEQNRYLDPAWTRLR